MIARRFTAEELSELKTGQRVAHLTGGGTGYRPVLFLGKIAGTERALIQPEGDVPTRKVGLKSLGPLQGRVEEASR